MLNENLKSRIKAWINKELDSYKKECGLSDYRMYLLEDCAAELAPDGPESFPEEIYDYIAKLLEEL